MNLRKLAPVAALAVAGMALTGCTLPTLGNGPTDACVGALEAADELLDLSREALGEAIIVIDASSEAMMDAASWNVAGIDRHTQTIEDSTVRMADLGDRVDAIPYDDLKTACLEGK